MGPVLQHYRVHYRDIRERAHQKEEAGGVEEEGMSIQNPLYLGLPPTDMICKRDEDRRGTNDYPRPDY